MTYWEILFHAYFMCMCTVRISNLCMHYYLFVHGTISKRCCQVAFLIFHGDKYFDESFNLMQIILFFQVKENMCLACIVEISRKCLMRLITLHQLILGIVENLNIQLWTSEYLAGLLPLGYSLVPKQNVKIFNSVLK